jgi:5-formyltetrahydrofolate cyclo-ligase
MSDSLSIPDQKAMLRNATLARRDALPATERQDAAATVAGRDFPLAVGAGTIVSGFFPMRSEINPLPLMRKLAAQGAQLALPVIAGRGKPLTMRAWNNGDDLASGQWGIREPTPQAPQVDPDVLIVPLACFDRRGHRIGYGAGYFDMTIHRLRGIKPVTAIGIAFAQQEIDRIPATEHDEVLDLVLTEREVIDLRRKT